MLPNSNQEKVDIILPNYNKGEFLKEAIDSVYAQTYKNWHLFIIDDNSNDNSRKILENYKNKKNITLFFLKKNKGVAFCRNLAMRKSKDRYISFLDSDDYWTPDKLEKQIFFMKETQCDFSYTNYSTVKLTKNKKIYKKITQPLNSYTFEKFVLDTSIAMSSVVINRSILGTTRFKTFKVCEDYLFKCKILKKCKTAFKLNKNTLFYRISKNSLQSNKAQSLYWVWIINKKHNKFSIFKNFKSVFFIIVNSIKKYGIK